MILSLWPTKKNTCRSLLAMLECDWLKKPGRSAKIASPVQLESS